MTIKMLGMMVLAAAMAFAAEVNGKWTAEMETPRGTMKQTFDFKSEGAKLTGTVAGARGSADITEGKIDGAKISFKVKRETPNGTMVQAFEGTVAADEIKLTMKMEGMDMPPREMVAKRDK